MERPIELFCRDQLRQARAEVLRDAEAFPQVLFALERTGSLVMGKLGTLGDYGKAIADLARRSPLAEEVPALRPWQHTPFPRLYELVQAGRNEALHQGAFARSLAGHAVELSLVLEDALVNGSTRIGDYMVKSPVCAQPWQPLSIVRQQMLANAFSCLPIWIKVQGVETWKLLSDFSIARVLRAASSNSARRERLAASVQEAIEKYGLELATPTLVVADDDIFTCLSESKGVPLLVVEESKRLIGIVTPFDLL